MFLFQFLVSLKTRFNSGAMFIKDKNVISDYRYIKKMFKKLKILLNDVNACVKKIALICEKVRGGWL